MMQSLRILMPLVIFISPCSYAIEGEIKGDVAKLKYGWYPGLSMSVQYNHVETTVKPNQEQKQITIDGNYIIKTRNHPKGLQVDFHEIYFNIKNSHDAEAENKLQRFMQELIGINPSYVIDQEGGLAEVTRFREFHAAINKEMQVFFEDTPEEELARIQQFLSNLLSEEQIMMQLQQDWNRDVGQWVDGELEQGYTYDVEFTQVMPLFGNMEIPNKGRYEFLGRVSCNKNSIKKCVHLSYVSQLDQEVTKQLLAKLFQEMGKELPESLDMKVDYAVEIITEENKLLPHYIKETRTTTAPAQDFSGMVEKKEEDVYVYTYLKL